MMEAPYARPADYQRVDIDDHRELRYWCGVLGATGAVLREAVRAVGRDVLDVQSYLGSRGNCAVPLAAVPAPTPSIRLRTRGTSTAP